MNWQPIDFQGIISLDSPVINLLHQYLDEQESLLARAILESIPSKLQPAILSYNPNTSIKLPDAIESFSKKCSLNHDEIKTLSPDTDWQPTVNKINKAYWQYTEILEGCVTELFQQLDHIGLEHWHSRLSEVISTIKELLSHKIEDLIWNIKRLEAQLWKFRLALYPTYNYKRYYAKISFLWSSLLDKKLTRNLNQTQSFLRMQYARFVKRYGNYLKLQEQVEKSLEKFDTYPVIAQLDRESQRLLKKLYQLLKLWEMNQSSKAVPSRELILALRHALSIEKAISLFIDYHAGLKTLLFSYSSSLKKQGEQFFEEEQSKETMEVALSHTHAEIHSLGTTISHYRDFLLRSDPDPYVRSRLGFSEWIVGPEPAQTKPLLELGYDVDHLDELCKHLEVALKRDPKAKGQISFEEVDPEISKMLHEMSQPLATRRMMRNRAENIIEMLEKLDEWGSFSYGIVDYVGIILSKLIRIDWKYHVSFEFNSFHQLYNIHNGLVEHVDDRSHVNRMQKFTKLLQRVQDWVSKHRTQRHFHDIELDMNDIKVYLQDFFAHAQRLSADSLTPREQRDKLIKDISQQLLEYRYLFGNFFYQLRQNENEGQLVRNQFLFVDQYFESIEVKLQEMRNQEYEIPEQGKEQEPNKEGESEDKEF